MKKLEMFSPVFKNHNEETTAGSYCVVQMKLVPLQVNVILCLEGSSISQEWARLPPMGCSVSRCTWHVWLTCVSILIWILICIYPLCTQFHRFCVTCPKSYFFNSSHIFSAVNYFGFCFTSAHVCWSKNACPSNRHSQSWTRSFCSTKYLPTFLIMPEVSSFHIW